MNHKEAALELKNNFKTPDFNSSCFPKHIDAGRFI